MTAAVIARYLKVLKGTKRLQVRSYQGASGDIMSLLPMRLHSVHLELQGVARGFLVRRRFKKAFASRQRFVALIWSIAPLRVSQAAASSTAADHS